jgi:hypothetical protein
MQECKNAGMQECRSVLPEPAVLSVCIRAFAFLHSCISAFLHSCIFEMPSSSQRLGLVVAVVAFAMYVLIRVQ